MHGIFNTLRGAFNLGKRRGKKPTISDYSYVQTIYLYESPRFNTLEWVPKINKLSFRAGVTLHTLCSIWWNALEVIWEPFPIAQSGMVKQPQVGQVWCREVSESVRVNDLIRGRIAEGVRVRSDKPVPYDISF